MALIKCPECKKKISDQCGNCPNCGYPIKKNNEIAEIEATDSVHKVPQKTHKPFFKRIWFWSVVAAVVVAATVTIILLLNGEVKPKVDKNGDPVFVELTDEVYTNADKYLGYYVNVKGKVFQNLGDNGEVKGVQVWIDPDNCEQNLMIHYTTEGSFKDGDYIVCTGYIKEIHTYTNTYGTKLSVPLIQSTDLRSSTYIEVMSPTISTLELENLLYEKYGYSINIEKVEFAENETRLYLSATNNGKATMYVDADASVIVQGGKQFNSKTNYEADYEEVPYNLSTGTTASGIVAFPAIDNGEFEYVIEMHSDNFDEQFEKIAFKISKDTSSVFIPVLEPNAVWDYDELKYETKGYTIAIDKVEFYDNETRIYFAAANDGKAVLYVDANGSIVVQNKKQFNTKSIYDAGYNELPYNIAKGASATGAVSFQGVETAEFEYTIEITSDDYDEEFDDVVFIINADSPSCKNSQQEELKKKPTTGTKPEQNTGSETDRYAAAITVAQSYVNAYSSATPNDVKSHMLANGYSETEINHALYNGYIDWSWPIREYIYGLNSETEEVVVTNCIRCSTRWAGEFYSCQDENCGGGVNWSYYHGYSRSVTKSRLLAVGFTQADVSRILAEYEYGSFIDEVDLGK